MAAQRLSPLRLGLICLVAIAAWISGGALSVASAQPRAQRIAVLPPMLWLGVGIAALIVAARWGWPRRSRAWVLTLSALVVLPWLPFPVPAAFYVWTGHLRVWLWLVITAALVVTTATGPLPAAVRALVFDVRRAPWTAAAAASIVYLAVAWQVFPQLPTGDEPHYLVIAESLLVDHDLRVENNYARADYHAYFPGELHPDYLRKGQNGEIYSIHAPGLPLLVSPVFAAFGYRGVIVLLALVAGCASALAWIAAWRVVGDVAAAWFGWASVALSMPFCFQAFVMYPDAPGAAMVIVGGLTLLEGHAATTRRLVGTGLALAVLPWLHTRLAVAASILGVLIVIRQLDTPTWPRRAAALFAVPVVGAVCWFGFFYLVYGTPDPRAPYGGSSQVSWSNIPRGLLGLAFDQQFGVLPNAPVYLCAALGFIPLIRTRRRVGIELLALVVPFVASAAAFNMWWAGYSSAARLLTPVLLLLSVPCAAWFHASRDRASRILGLGGLAVSLLVTATIAAVDRGALVYNSRDGFSRLLLWLSPLVDLTRGVPSLFQNAPLTVLAQAAVWLSAIALTAVTAQWVAGRGAKSGVVAAAMGCSAALTGMLALSIVWRSNGAIPLTPTTGNVMLLETYDRGSQQMAIQYAPLKRLPLAEVPPRLMLASVLPASRTASPDVGGPLIRIPHPPAGTYSIEIALSKPGAGAVTVAIDPRFGPVWTWDLTAARGSWRREFRLPVAPASIFVDGDGAARQAIDRLIVRALDVIAPRDRVADVEPWHVTRYGPAVVFLIDGRAYMEPGGTWVAGNAYADFVIAPDAVDEGDMPVHLIVRNPPLENRITLDAGGWHHDLNMRPGEERMVDIPVAPGRWAVALRVTAARGARPSEFERGSTDTRLLGCWIETR